MLTAAERKEQQQWAIEKPKITNARKLRGINLIHPDDKQFKETTKKKTAEKVGIAYDDIILAGRKQNLNPKWKKLMKLVDLGGTDTVS